MKLNSLYEVKWASTPVFIFIMPDYEHSIFSLYVSVPFNIQFHCSSDFSQHTNDSCMTKTLNVFSIDLWRKNLNVLEAINCFRCIERRGETILTRPISGEKQNSSENLETRDIFRETWDNSEPLEEKKNWEIEHNVSKKIRRTFQIFGTTFIYT